MSPDCVNGASTAACISSMPRPIGHLADVCRSGSRIPWLNRTSTGSLNVAEDAHLLIGTQKGR